MSLFPAPFDLSGFPEALREVERTVGVTGWGIARAGVGWPACVARVLMRDVPHVATAPTPAEALRAALRSATGAADAAIRKGLEAMP